MTIGQMIKPEVRDALLERTGQLRQLAALMKSPQKPGRGAGDDHDQAAEQ